MSAQSPWAWHPHPFAWAVVVALAVAYVTALRKLGPVHAPPRPVCTRRQVTCFSFGLLALAVATTWPIADLAAHWSLLAHMFDLSLLALAAAPLLLLGLPRWLVGLATQDATFDSVIRRLTRPWTATLVFNAAVVGSLVPAVISAGNRYAAVFIAVQLVVFLAATVMWIPALRLLPGPNQMSTGGRIGYLFLQSVLPNFPALIYIFANHPIYATFAAGAPVFGLSGMTDQQLAGAVAKLCGISVMWGAAAIILVKAQKAEEEGLDPDPLTWEDVESELKRLDRRGERRTGGGGTG